MFSFSFTYPNLLALLGFSEVSDWFIVHQLQSDMGSSHRDHWVSCSWLRAMVTVGMYAHVFCTQFVCFRGEHEVILECVWNLPRKIIRYCRFDCQIPNNC